MALVLRDDDAGMMLDADVRETLVGGLITHSGEISAVTAVVTDTFSFYLTSARVGSG
jgi:hypothetical protein